MAYEKTKWLNGDNISADKLNKMEAGIEYGCSLEHEITDPVDGQVMKYDAAKGKWVNAEAPSGGSEKLVVNLTRTDEGEGNYRYESDKTWQQIHDAFPNVIIKETLNSTEFLYIADTVGVDPDPDPEVGTENAYAVKFYSARLNNDMILTADSPAEYPDTYATR